MGCHPRWLADSVLIRLAQHQTMEVAVEGVSVANALAKMEVIAETRVGGHTITTVAIPRADHVRHMDPRSKPMNEV